MSVSSKKTERMILQTLSHSTGKLEHAVFYGDRHLKLLVTDKDNRWARCGVDGFGPCGRFVTNHVMQKAEPSDDAADC